MGCSAAKENIVIEVTYCGGCGWTIPARKVCEAIKQRLPTAVIDCRPEEVFTGVLEVNLLVGDQAPKEKKFVFKGDKDTVLANAESIGQQVESAYDKA